MTTGNLNLVSKGKRAMSIAMFGSALGSRLTCELGVELRDGTSQLLRVPVICEPIAGVELTSVLTNFRISVNWNYQIPLHVVNLGELTY